ncbi:MAG: M48 family metallopeptidase [Desulfobacterales bacterium]|nr:M48 family metallopeptidase [Desulfobacterales bacterium]
MKEAFFQLNEVIIYKKGIKRCSGRVRDGKFLYYISDQVSKDRECKIIIELRKKLAKRLKEAGQFIDYFRENSSKIDNTIDLKKIAIKIYTKKYHILDFPLTIKFRKQRTVMGTYRMNNDGTVIIYINNLLKNAPIVILEYIVAHELSHHRFSGHTHKFYDELSQLCPEMEIKKRLAGQYLLLKEAKFL